jgi:hypothetical protein
VSNWYQQALTPPDVLELNIRIGVIPSEDHLQALVELKDPTTGVLLGQWSRPHATMREQGDVIGWALQQALLALGDHTEPF